MNSYRLSVKREAPLNMIPTLPCKPTSTSPSPGSVTSVSTHLCIPAEQKDYYGLYCTIIESRSVFPPGGDIGSTWNPACFMLDLFLSFFSFFDEQKPLGRTHRAHSNRSQPLWKTNASHGDRYAAACSRLCSFLAVPHLLWERSRSEVRQLSPRPLFTQDLSDKLLQSLSHFTDWIKKSFTFMTAVKN